MTLDGANQTSSDNDNVIDDDYFTPDNESPIECDSGVGTFFYEIVLCERLRLTNQEKQGGKDKNRFDDIIVAIIDKLLKYKCFTPTPGRKNWINLIFY